MRQLDTPAVQERGGAHKDAIGPLATHCFEGDIDLSTGIRIEDLHLQPHGANGLVHGLQLSLSICVSWIDEHCDAPEVGHQLTQKLHPLCRHLRIENIDSCEIAAWPR